MDVQIAIYLIKLFGVKSKSPNMLYIKYVTIQYIEAANPNLNSSTHKGVWVLKWSINNTISLDLTTPFYASKELRNAHRI